MRLLIEGGSYFFALALRAATIRGRLLFDVRLLFEGGYYSMCGYYSRAATIRCAATIRINMVIAYSPVFETCPFQKLVCCLELISNAVTET